jgi:hypothetical protein
MRAMRIEPTILTAAMLAAGSAYPACPARAADALPSWRWVRTVAPQHATPGSFGAAVSSSDGRLWIGPSRDLDVGDGPPQVTAVGILAGFGLPGSGDSLAAHPDADRTAGFGLALAASHDACVVGSPHAGCRRRGCDTGQAHLVTPAHDGTWSVDEVACPEPEPASEFGASVATDGTTIVIGSPRFDGDGTAVDSGAVDVYRLGPAPDRLVTHVARLRPPAPATGARFGSAVAVDGDWIAIGEPGAGPTLPRAGVVHLAHRAPDGTWSHHASLRTPAGAQGWLGASLALADGELLAGAPVARDPARRIAAGAVAHFHLRDGAWTLRRVVHGNDLGAGAGFGQALAIADGWGAVGAPGEDAGAEDAGAAFALELRSGRLRRIEAPTPRAGAGFGAGLAFGTGAAGVALGPQRFLAVAGRADPELPAIPGMVELYGLRAAAPVLITRRASQAQEPPPPRSRGPRPPSPSPPTRPSRPTAAIPPRPRAPRHPPRSGAR